MVLDIDKVTLANPTVHALAYSMEFHKLKKP